jgi:assimilatory nitrate reductase catalytic subunit
MAATHCPYCALQCGTEVSVRDDGRVSITGDAGFPVNRGALCIKGWTAGDALSHRDRLTTPLVRDALGRLVPATWEDAMARVAVRMQAVQSRYGRDAVAVFGGGGLTNEKAYLLGKLARVALRTRNVDYRRRSAPNEDRRERDAPSAARPRDRRRARERDLARARPRRARGSRVRA